MRKIRVNVFCFVLFVFLCGCGATVHNKKEVKELPKQQENQADVESALHSVVGAISGQEINEKELRDLARQLRKDKEAQSAVQAITGSVEGGVIVKYCPITGKRYSSRFEKCPEHEVLLNEVE